jgi:hypothetical protein
VAKRSTLVVLLGLAAGICSFSVAPPATAQRKPLDSADQAATVAYQRTRLILKNGSYQMVLSYKVEGNLVSYRSAERNGELEDIPLRLVDMPATAAWYREHVEGIAPEKPEQRPVLSPELAKEEADRAALTPEVAPNLRLPQELSVVVLDTFEGTPELVPVPQQGTDLNKETAHGTLKQAINPASSPHRILELQRPRADVQLHVAEPVFYVRIGDDLAEGGGGFTVDTHGADFRETPTGGQAGSAYVIERLDARQDSRIVDSFRIAWLNGGRKQPDVIETRQQDLPGGHWMKLTPTQPLEFGEYALIEVVSDHEVNLNVWEFGVHAGAKENIEAIRPDARNPAALKNRKP